MPDARYRYIERALEFDSTGRAGPKRGRGGAESPTFRALRFLAYFSNEIFKNEIVSVCKLLSKI